MTALRRSYVASALLQCLHGVHLVLSDITNKGLPNGVLSEHLRSIWKEAKFERSAWIKEHRATILPNVGIIYVLGIISVRVDRKYITENRGGWAG